MLGYRLKSMDLKWALFACKTNKNILIYIILFKYCLYKFVFVNYGSDWSQATKIEDLEIKIKENEE